MGNKLNMELLRYYSPAEVLFILKENEVTLNDYISFTLRDLMLRGIISSQSMVKTSHSQDPARVLRYLSVGKNYSSFKPKPHESVFLDTLSNQKPKTVIKYVLKEIYKEVGNSKSFRNKVLENNSIHSIAYRNLLNKLNGTYSTKDTFEKIQVDLRNEIKILSAKIQLLASENPIAIADIINTINGNIFHVKGFDIRMLKGIDPGLLKDANIDFSYFIEPSHLNSENDWDVLDLFYFTTHNYDSDNSSLFDWDWD